MDQKVIHKWIKGKLENSEELKNLVLTYSRRNQTDSLFEKLLQVVEQITTSEVFWSPDLIQCFQSSLEKLHFESILNLWKKLIDKLSPSLEHPQLLFILHLLSIFLKNSPLEDLPPKSSKYFVELHGNLQEKIEIILNFYVDSYQNQNQEFKLETIPVLSSLLDILSCLSLLLLLFSPSSYVTEIYNESRDKIKIKNIFDFNFLFFKMDKNIFIKIEKFIILNKFEFVILSWIRLLFSRLKYLNKTEPMNLKEKSVDYLSESINCIINYYDKLKKPEIKLNFLNIFLSNYYLIFEFYSLYSLPPPDHFSTKIIFEALNSNCEFSQLIAKNFLFHGFSSGFFQMKSLMDLVFVNVIDCILQIFSSSSSSLSSSFCSETSKKKKMKKKEKNINKMEDLIFYLKKIKKNKQKNFDILKNIFNLQQNFFSFSPSLSPSLSTSLPLNSSLSSSLFLPSSSSFSFSDFNYEELNFYLKLISEIIQPRQSPDQKLTTIIISYSSLFLIYFQKTQEISSIKETSKSAYFSSDIFSTFSFSIESIFSCLSDPSCLNLLINQSENGFVFSFVYSLVECYCLYFQKVVHCNNIQLEGFYREGQKIIKLFKIILSNIMIHNNYFDQVNYFVMQLKKKNKKILNEKFDILHIFDFQILIIFFYAIDKKLNQTQLCEQTRKILLKIKSSLETPVSEIFSHFISLYKTEKRIKKLNKFYEEKIKIEKNKLKKDENKILIKIFNEEMILECFMMFITCLEKIIIKKNNLNSNNSEKESAIKSFETLFKTNEELFLDVAMQILGCCDNQFILKFTFQFVINSQNISFFSSKLSQAFLILLKRIQIILSDIIINNNYYESNINFDNKNNYEKVNINNEDKNNNNDKINNFNQITLATNDHNKNKTTTENFLTTNNLKELSDLAAILFCKMEIEDMEEEIKTMFLIMDSIDLIDKNFNIITSYLLLWQSLTSSSSSSSFSLFSYDSELHPLNLMTNQKRDLIYFSSLHLIASLQRILLFCEDPFVVFVVMETLCVFVSMGENYFSSQEISLILQSISSINLEIYPSSSSLQKFSENQIMFFYKIFNSFYKILNDLVLHNPQFVSYNAPLYFFSVRKLLLACMWAGQQQPHHLNNNNNNKNNNNNNKNNNNNIYLLEKSALCIARLSGLMSDNKEFFKKGCHYLVADYVDALQKVTLLPGVKKILMQAISKWFDLCDEPMIFQLENSPLQSFQKNIFSQVYNEYKKYYKYKAKN